jgi:hypothetical protein
MQHKDTPSSMNMKEVQKYKAQSEEDITEENKDKGKKQLLVEVAIEPIT